MNLLTSKNGNHFRYSLILVGITVSIVLLAFLTEQGLTGYVVSEQQEVKEFEDFDALSGLAPGNYYINSDGYVFWTDDGAILVGKLNHLSDSQKAKKIYIDNEGRVGYLLE